MSLADQVKTIRQFFDSGATRPLAFRREQLKKLSAAICKYEEEICRALYTDLRKSPEESWATEIGLIQAEIRHTLGHLSQWASPQHRSTNLVNLPSSSEVRPEPYGVVLIVGPWNYPFLLMLSPLISAMAAGNCVVLKGPEQTPVSSSLMKKIISETFGADYILYLEGDGKEILPGLIRDSDLDHLFFTGSTEVGRIIYRYAAEKLLPVTLELGGKSPCVVTADANITVAAKRITLAKFSNAGQMCVAPDYILVQEEAYGALVDAITRCIRDFYGEDPSRSPDYGRVVNRAHIDRLAGFLSDGKVLLGGKTDPESLYMEPTLMTPASMQTRLMREEIFGPILPILTYRDMAGAISIIRQNPNPLAFYVFTSKRREADAWLEAVPAGGACVNNVSWHLTNYNLPFGGRGNSGIGSYHGKFGFDRFSHMKAVMRTPTWFEPSVKHPPFSGKLRLFKWLIR